MSFSVNTNTGALVALQYLTATQGQLNQTQSAINSGLKVATARDDGAIYAIAQNQRGAVAGYSVGHQLASTTAPPPSTSRCPPASRFRTC